MRKRISLLALLSVTTLAAATLLATPDCTDDAAASLCCETYHDSTPSQFGGRTVCAFYGHGCVECTNRNTGGSCASVEECTPTGGGIKTYIPDV